MKQNEFRRFRSLIPTDSDLPIASAVCQGAVIEHRALPNSQTCMLGLVVTVHNSIDLGNQTRRR